MDAIWSSLPRAGQLVEGAQLLIACMIRRINMLQVNRHPAGARWGAVPKLGGDPTIMGIR